MHELLIVGGPGLICILLVAGHFLLRCAGHRRQPDLKPGDEHGLHS